MKAFGLIFFAASSLAASLAAETPCYCLGPANSIANAPARPTTCDGDIFAHIKIFYWTAHQDGMEFALRSELGIPIVNPTPTELEELNNLIEASYLTPGSSWEFGFTVGIGYSSACDGWDLRLNWTNFHDLATTKNEAANSDHQTLLPLWSAFNAALSSPLFAREVSSSWKVELNLVDLELGREFWVSHYLTLRPQIGLRYGMLDQNLDLEHKGGSWSPRTSPTQSAFTNKVELDQKFRGLGIRSSLETDFHLGCGFGIYGELAASILYGHFELRHDETNRQVAIPHTKTKILDTESSIRASRAILDTALGIEWSGHFCECNYGLSIRAGFEQHLFFHQNQLWRVTRATNGGAAPLPNNSGENTFEQRRGTFSAQGFTLSATLSF